MSRSLSSTFTRLASAAAPRSSAAPPTPFRCLALPRLTPPRASPALLLSRSYASSPRSPIRTASTTATIPIAHAPSPSTPKPKHKPTRKATLEAAPIRASTSETRSHVRHIYSFSTSTSYNLPLLSSSLPPSARLIPLNPSGSETCYWVPLGSKSQAISGEGPRDEKTGLVDSVDLGSEENGEIWILENGSFVSWGIERDKALAWWEELSKPDGFEVGRYESMEEESLDFYFDPAEPSTRLQGDIIILAPATNASVLRQADSLPAPSSLLSRFAFSEALSRSSQLSVLEAQLHGLIDRSEGVPSYLAKHGKGPYKRKEVIQKLGEFLVVRQAVNLQGVGDTPELYWDEPVLEQYFTGLVRALEVRQRVHDLNSKISHAQEVHTILKDLLTEKSGHHMELIIIVIIAVEATIAVWGHWEELMRSIGLVAREPKEV